MRFIRAKKCICFLAALVMSIPMSACGLRSAPEPLWGGTGEKNVARGEAEGISEENEDSREFGNEAVAVADFFYLQMPDVVVGGLFVHYAIDDTFLYYTAPVYEGEDIGALTHVVRKRIFDGHTEESHIISEKNRARALDKALLVDRKGCCYLFWEPGLLAEEEDHIYSLEKYGADGKLLWHTDYTPEELQGVGEGLGQGIVTEDGRIFLYTYGENGRIFAFDARGELENVYTPGLTSLEGICAGKDGRVYAYCVTGQEPEFLELDGEGNTYVSPMVPLKVYSGYENGIYLCTGEGMWSYEPDTGKTELLWGWEDEYVQIDGSYVERVFPGDRGCVLLWTEQGSDFDQIHDRQVLAFAMVTHADSQNYPAKCPVTLSVCHKESWIDKMVKLYNRHSKKYKVEIVSESSESSLESKLVRGEGPDLINIGDIYAENLAELGIFEELGSYYEASEIVSREDILEPVQKACTIHGREVGVIPAFCIRTMQAKEVWYTREEWDIWNFLEMARGNRMFQAQDPYAILNYCMGLRYGEAFIDWDKKESHFDRKEFGQILEACKNCGSYGGGGNFFYGGFEDEYGKESWRFLENTEISSAWDVISEQAMFSGRDPEYAAKLVGFPGWNGGEYELGTYGMFAINSASENKEGAWDFLEYLLSEEYQRLLDWAFPVRKDSFEIYLNDLYDNGKVDFYSETGERIDSGPTEEDLAFVRDMVEFAVYDDWGGKRNPIRIIVGEEAEMYFAGDATLEDTVTKIQNRVQLYLDEH